MKNPTLARLVTAGRLANNQIAEREAERQVARHEAHRRSVVDVLLCEFHRLMVTAHLLWAAERRGCLRSLVSPPPEPAQTPGIRYPR